MSVDQRKKERFCGYCGIIYDDCLEDFMIHLNYCELIKAHEAGEKRKKDNNGNGLEKT